MKSSIILVIFFMATLVPVVSAHQIDSVGEEYRIQIGWMREPAVSGESNGIELYVSPLDTELSPEKQPFKDGITGLQKDLKIQLVLRGETITLPLRVDHNVPGKYFALVEPTESGFYQVNILGNIDNTTVSKSLHAPKVENKTYLQFPQLDDDEILEEHKTLKDEILSIQNSIKTLESSKITSDGEYIGIVIGIIIAIGISIVALMKRK